MVTTPPRVAYIGNHSVRWSTESHVSKSFRSLGCEVLQIQAGPDAFRRLTRLQGKVQLVLCSRASDHPADQAAAVFRDLEDHGAVTAAYDLDRFAGLPRISELHTKALFRTGHLFGADGHPDSVAAYEAAGVTFHFLPAGVVHDECERGTYRRRWAAKVAFVGSRGYHADWPHRPQLIDWLHDTYGEAFLKVGDGNARSAPMQRPGDEIAREADLNDLYASVDVAVGDSMLLHGAADRYVSDRVFESLGRWGFLIHPQTDWLDDLFHGLLASWTLGDFDDLAEQVERWCSDPTGRATRMAELHRLVVEKHTYRERCREILSTVGLM